MTDKSDAHPARTDPSREEALEAENARLRMALARAGVDVERALAEAATSREETRLARDNAADAATGHTRELEAGRVELADAEALNEGLRRANAALGESEDRYRAVLESAADYAIITTDQRGCITGWNAGARDVLGWSEGEVLQQDAALIFTPEDRDAGVPEAEMRAVLEHGTAADERWHMRRDGTRFWAQGQLTPLRDGGGGLQGFLKILRDRTEQRAAERERERLLAMLGQSQAMVCDWQGRIEVWTQGMERLFGFTAAEAVDVLVRELLRSEYPAPWAEIVGALRREGRWAGEVRHRAKDGSLRVVQATWLVQPGLDGEPSSLVVAEEDQTNAKRAEAALRESEARFRHMADSAPALIWMSDERGQVVFVNMHYEHLFGRPTALMLGQGWEQVALAEDLPGYREAFRDAFRARRTFQAEGRMRDRHGQVRWLRCEAVPRLDDVGTFLGYTGCAVDVTDAKLAAETLEHRVEARTAELMTAEATLRQAQKMEAVGQLTGGIAHDFNNMLQAIGGNLEMMQTRVVQGRAAEANRYVEGARAAVERAAALTHRLLAFARRQVLQPRPVNPDELVEDMAELIRRTVGPGVVVELRLGDGSWPVQCDPNQLENALLNLCINARDAMPEGGRLAITTRYVRLAMADVAGQEGAAPGEYVEVAVADTGSGMDEATRARVFEPFFTTKPLGQGTGLGLSQLYGFVRQSYGVVHLDSAPGQGTTVRLYLPRHGQAGASETEGKEPETDGEQESTDVGACTGSETVLLVEDEAGVRASVAEHLRELGYVVVEAEDGPAALRALQGSLGARVDLLVTDVGLPNGLNGRQLAEMARARRPSLSVLFITGYAGVALEGQLVSGMAVIGKPFTLDALATRVRAMIEGEGAARP